jgi:outer membrane receptor for ferrienterochelin and colicins
VPGTWLQTIDVGKGAGPVVIGYESMAGQINLTFKAPETKEQLYLNAYVNAMSRLELNANYSAKLSDKVETIFMLHGNTLNADMDRNDDGFLDIPKGRQFNIMNRYKITGERVVQQLGFQVMHDERIGGQVGFGFNEDPLTSSRYGLNLGSRRYELYGKTGVLFPNKPYKGLGFIYSGVINERRDIVGRNTYEGTEKSFYLNSIYQGIIGNTFHKYRVGASLQLDNYDEVLNDSTFQRNEVVPGAYAEYSFSGPHAWSFVAGVRGDYHNLYGLIITPRFHLQYGFTDESAIRFSFGKGTRVPNVIAENTSLLAASRRFVVQEEILPEESWNIGGSVTHSFDIAGKPLSLVTDYFHTRFLNQLVVDRDQDIRAVNFYNLDGESFANSFQVEAKYELIKNLTAKAAYKFYQVKTTYQNFGLRDAPFIPKDRFFINLEYATFYDKWVFDWTGQWYGNQRIPDTEQNQQEYQRPASSPSYFVMNAQIRRSFRWGSVYLGGENILDYRQDDPIIDPQNPFDNNFDATLVWGPVAGRAIYAGVRYKLNKPN